MKLTPKTPAEVREAIGLLQWAAVDCPAGSVAIAMGWAALEWARGRPVEPFAALLERSREHMRACPDCASRYLPNSPGPAACSPTPSGAGTHPCS